ncbi:MAG: hypothetical protein J6S76_00480 [Clostridia bacterium]|nr:hypothetical protein [Clostridia bacterium]
MIRSSVCRRARCMLCAVSALFAQLSKPVFIICFCAGISPALLLTPQLIWRSVFHWQTVPQISWLSFLPLWILLSCALPSFCAAALLSMRCCSPAVIARPAVICTGLLLIAICFGLLLLYGMPYPLCVICCALSVLLAFGGIPQMLSISKILGVLLLLCGIWNTCLLGICLRM